MWFITFIFLVFDAPENHPRISPDEQQYIERSIAEATYRRRGLLHSLILIDLMEYFTEMD